MTIKENIEELVLEFCSGTISEADRLILKAWIEVSEENRKQFRKMVRVYFRVTAAGKWDELDNVQQKMWKRMQPALGNRHYTYLRIVQIAAVLTLLFLSTCLWFVMRHNSPEKEYTSQEMNLLKAEAGSAKAILKLAHGEEILLGRGESKNIANVQGVELTQDAAGGLFVGQESQDKADVTPVYHTVIVPEGGEYFITLSDGTKVWINSASELSFPLSFSNNEREVILKGEAYFEVAYNAGKPFLVKTAQASVKVLGTSFNVMAYAEDLDVQVALLKGKVSFDVSSGAYILVPGEIAILDKSTGKTTVETGNVEAAVSWKTGVFDYEDMALEELVIKLRRWYGIPFEFKDESCRQLRFSGAVTKYRTLDYMLDMISKTTLVKFVSEDGYISVHTRDK